MVVKMFVGLVLWFIKIWICCLAWTVLWIWENVHGGSNCQVSQDEKLREERQRVDKIVSQISLCPEILEQIFKSSHLEHLKKCRLVCKTWNREICQTLSKSAWIVRVDKGNMSKFREEMESRDVSLPPPFDEVHLVAGKDISMENFLWLSSNFKITRLNTISYLANNPMEEAQKFVQTCAPTLTQLYTRILGKSWDESMELNFPQLEVLHVHASMHTEPENPEGPFILRILSSAPKLSQLSIAGTFVAEILQKASLKKVRNLQVVECKEMAVWTALGQCDIGDLSHLDVYISFAPGDTFDLNSCQHPLSRFSESLRRLRIGMTRFNKYGGHPSNFPFCPYLTHLELCKYSPGELDFSNLPNLTHLTFKYVVACSDSSDSLSGSQSVQNVFLREYIIKSEDVQAVSKVREATFAQLFLRFPNSRRWAMNYRNVVNFSRAAESSAFDVRDLTVVVSSRHEDDEEMIQLEDRHLLSNVAKLKDLESLGLYTVARHSWTDIRVRELDFDKFPKLKVLRVRSDSRPSFEDYVGIKDDVKIIIAGPRKFNGAEGILSKGSVDFVPYSSKHLDCACIDWSSFGNLL